MPFPHLTDPRFTRELESIFSEYHDRLEALIETATIENRGVRPAHIENEIYSLFHHVSRSLNDIENIDNAIKEVVHAKKTHLHRAVYDSYKIIINTIIVEEKNITAALDELVLHRDFRDCISDAIVNLTNIKTKKTEIKQEYILAKKEERKGHYDLAVTHYDATLGKANGLQELLRRFEGDGTFQVAIKHFAKEEKREKKISRRQVLIPVVCSILAASLTFAGNLLIQKSKANASLQATSQPSQSTAMPTPQSATPTP